MRGQTTENQRWPLPRSPNAKELQGIVQTNENPVDSLAKVRDRCPASKVQIAAPPWLVGAAYSLRQACGGGSA